MNYMNKFSLYKIICILKKTIKLAILVPAPNHITMIFIPFMARIATYVEVIERYFRMAT
jgi:hypothetical protein